MIKRTIKVELLKNEKTGKVGFNLDEIAEEGQKGYEVDYSERQYIFTLFTNKGKVSKSNKCSIEMVNHKVEELLAEELKIESERESDTKKAIKLANIVNQAFKNVDDHTEWVTIKTKTSQSDWYRKDDVFNAPSEYLTQVPANVEKEALALQAIRRKHQDDQQFDFMATDYQKRTVRVADHDNGRYDVDMEMDIDD